MVLLISRSLIKIVTKSLTKRMKETAKEISLAKTELPVITKPQTKANFNNKYNQSNQNSK